MSDQATLPQARIDLYPTQVVVTTYDGPLVTSKPVSPRSLAGIFTGLTASSGLLPPNALFWKIDDEDQPECGIFIEAHRRKLVIDDATAFTIPLPPLIFTGCKQKYRLFAVKARPMHGRERLYYPPLSNIMNSSAICKGNGELPDADWSTIDKAFELFMSAQFAPHLVRNRFKDYPNNVHEGWEKLALFGPDTFPLDQLVATQLTVGDII